MRFASLASGSSGNCTYIGTDHTHLLIDAGISCRRIDENLKSLGVRGDELSAVLITHEHTDHIQGLKVFCKKHHVPVYATSKTIEVLKHMDSKGELDAELFRPVLPDGEIAVGDFLVRPFSNSHDAVDPVGYRVSDGKYSAAVATDLGIYSEYTIQNLIGLDVLLLESNHDIRMLEAGPYPFPLKRRILGARGHLSNESAGRLLNEILHEGMRHVFLGHISKDNNFEELARETVCTEIETGNCPYHAQDFPITTAHRDSMSEVINLGE